MFWLALGVLATAMSLGISPGLRQAVTRFGPASLACADGAFYPLLGAIFTARAHWDWLPFALTALAFPTLGTLM